MIYPAPSDEPLDDQRAFLLRTLVQSYADEYALGEMYGSRVLFVLSRYCCLEPDLSFVAAKRLSMMEAESGCGAPDIAIEFVSPCSRTRDYAQKRVIYEEAGVQEYWIINPLQRCCQFLRLLDGQFTEIALHEGRVFHSSVLPGFWLDVDWLFTEPLPRAKDCLKRIPDQ